MTKPKFSVGDRVKVLPDRLNSNLRPGIYTIVQAMPETNQGRQYPGEKRHGQPRSHPRRGPTPRGLSRGGYASL